MNKKRINIKKCGLILYLTVLSNFAFSQYPIIRNFSKKTTNAGPQNWDIIQGKNDWMYFANNYGLLEFDGEEWSYFSNANYTNIRSLYYDEKNDRIYAGASNEFGYYEKTNTGKRSYVSLMSKLDEKNRNFNEIWGIEKHGNTVYFQGDNSIFKYENGKITRFIVKERISKIAFVNSFLLVATERDGVFIFNDNIMIPLPNNALMKGKKICAILPYKNKILFVTEFDGIFQFDNQTISKMPTDIDDFIVRNQVFCAAIQDDIIAVGTVRNGVVIKDLIKNTNIFSNIKTGLQNNTVLSVTFDRLGNVWLGLDKGIDYISYNSYVFDFFGNNNLYGSGYASVLKGSDLFLGTNQGLYTVKYPLVNGENGISVKSVGSIQGQIWNLSIVDDFLFCGADHGAFIVTNGTAQKIEHTPGTWGFRAFLNRSDLILASSYNGFYLLKKTNGQWLFYKTINGFSEYGINFEIDENSQIWMSHWKKGVYKLTMNKTMDSIERTELFNDQNGLESNENNKVAKNNGKIIISAEKHFYFYNPAKNKIEKYSFLEKLFGTSNLYNKLFFFKNNDIWNISNVLISRAKYNNHSYAIDSTNYSVLKGKIVAGFEHMNYLDSNYVLIGTEDGYSIANLQKSKINNDTILNVAIKEVHLTRQNDSIVNCSYCLNTKKTPEFNYNENSIRFEFIATEYRKEDAIAYSYRLVGFENNWSEYTLNRNKEYTNLKKGKYVFMVRAKNSFNNLTSETSYTFAILPAWYESIVAKIFYFLLILFALYMIARYLNAKSDQKIVGITEMKEQEMKLQKQHFMKEAEKKETEIINLKNQKLHYELRHKSQDLASSTMNLIRKNEVLLEINSDLDKLEEDILSKKDAEKTIEQLRKMQLYIKKNIQYDNSWKKFQENFDLVYENYLKRLGEQYPKLTVSDKKLCAYLKMNLNSKEIAPLLNMSYRSVEMSRYRLRKKLELDRNINLTDFLQKF